MDNDEPVIPHFGFFDQAAPRKPRVRFPILAAPQIHRLPDQTLPSQSNERNTSTPSHFRNN